MNAVCQPFRSATRNTESTFLCSTRKDDTPASDSMAVCMPVSTSNSVFAVPPP